MALIALRKLEVTLTADMDAISEAVARVGVGWAERLEAHCEANGLPTERGVKARVVPTAELLDLLACGKAFRIETDFKAMMEGGNV